MPCIGQSDALERHICRGLEDSTPARYGCEIRDAPSCQKENRCAALDIV